MARDEEMKRIFREGWCNESVVSHRVTRFIDGEFGFGPSRLAWREALRQAASSCEGRRALDMGTGPGTIAQIWAELGYQVTGVDFSPTMLTAARAVAMRQKLAIQLVEADVERPPFPAAAFDLVSSRAVLFTLPHPGYAVARWVQLLRPGGLLVLIGENAPTEQERIERQYRPAAGWRPSEEYLAALEQLPLREHTDSVARVVMEAAGLESIRTIPMRAVTEARREHETLEPEYGVLQGTPYILVGRRPSAG
ncbi:class I SAM-dependent methyltransferase [Candidatus Laterigemmans baculatus]|uniref:class I SAM-dependent methyltransferase n=1 Tax=Candidatus Laterigemmans baculatus TaxID=2770505 RepID=UPI0013DA8EF5|nr:class I SAM-dependent methyltransferase [Candidatus Laterigemmans baculatus]